MTARLQTILMGSTLVLILLSAIALLPDPVRGPDPSNAPGPTPAGQQASLPTGPLQVVASAAQIIEQEARSLTHHGSRDPFSYGYHVPEQEQPEEVLPAPDLAPVPEVFAVESQAPEAAPVVAIVPAIRLPQLKGICSLGEDRGALLDQVLAREGDILPSGYCVQHITTQSVTLTKGDESILLHLRGTQ